MPSVAITPKTKNGFLTFKRPWSSLNYFCETSRINHEGYRIILKESHGDSTRGLMGEDLIIHGVRRVKTIDENTLILVTKRFENEDKAVKLPILYFEHTDLLAKCLQKALK